MQSLGAKGILIFIKNFKSTDVLIVVCFSTITGNYGPGGSGGSGGYGGRSRY